jgi:Clp amino terminal domain, pathogenicity island component
MTPLNVNLQRLIEAIDTDLPTADPVDKVSEAQQRARSLSDIGDQLIDHFVTRARSTGTPWAQIGDALGVTRQAAQQRWVPPVYQRFTNRARHVVVLAQEWARTLRHGHIGTEHLLLGVLDETEGLGAKILIELAGSAEAVREPLVNGLRPDVAVPPAKIPFTQLGKEALGHANAESAALGHDWVGTEHVLLGLLKIPDGTAAQVLLTLNVSHEEARAKVMAA